MKASRIIVVTLAVLLLAAVPMWVSAWSAPDAQAAAADSSHIWSTPKVLAEAQPGLTNEGLKQIADSKLERIRKNMSGEGALNRQDTQINFSYPQAYRVYSMAERDIINGYDEKGSLGECISSEYRWYVPLVSGEKTVGTGRLAEREDGSWGLVAYGEVSEEECSLLGNLDQIEAMIARKGLENVTEIKAARLPYYFTIMLYVYADGDEYAALTSQSKFIDLQSHELYSAKDFVGAIEKAFGRIVPQPLGEPASIFFGNSGK